MSKGRLYLVPNTLDFGVATELAALDDVLPRHTLHRAAQLTHWVVENAKTARAFLKRVDAVFPLTQPLQALSIQELPRPAKGRPEAESTASTHGPLLQPAHEGMDIGLLSEAGLPAVADPGSALVALAHSQGIEVVTLPGSSSLVLALAASGLQGQCFAFIGYLPVEPASRQVRIRELEQRSRREGQTQLAIETPYRNPALLDALLQSLQPGTLLSVSTSLCTPKAWTRTAKVADWRRQPSRLPNDQPAMFSWLADSKG
ncbi:16S rRNA (cytidine1402-2'-O)-methyltransferase [Inhella inkyongensis]|uniref:16S rRNA (Cytidine1402-2'-O)-methyltransferase n=1 Tax=Inhella inkyongensis TaxID=392593 RepID=A0A840S4H6_9BURK|nr:SAM-dependent methyltransferase [Inhella inkyongensis]MBB5204462.1 16S rRNA (cytidine1402-2'-O)-methyltransferase [Inhella inkyongensis]